MNMSQEQSILIDNISYPVASLTDNAKLLLTNIQFIDSEIARLNTLLAVTQTARGTYFIALKNEVTQPKA